MALHPDEAFGVLLEMDHAGPAFMSDSLQSLLRHALEGTGESGTRAAGRMDR
jgi:hypothetical protein